MAQDKSTKTGYGHRFWQCRIIAGYKTMGQASKATGIGTGAISDYENDKRIPTAPAIVTLADAYDVSVDFLLGRTNTTEHKGRTISI